MINSIYLRSNSLTSNKGRTNLLRSQHEGGEGSNHFESQCFAAFLSDCNFYNCISSVGIIPLFRIILRSKYHWFHLFWIQSLLTLDLWQCLLFSRVWNRTYDHKRRMMSNFVNFQRTCKTAKCSKRCWILKTFDLLLIWLPQENTLLIFT